MRQKDQDKAILYFLAIFALALFLRIVRLGVLPLSEPEAVYAWQALTIARGEPVGVSNQLGYTGLTALSFFLGQGSNFWARWWPAMAGSLLVFLPYIWRKQLGSLLALTLSAGLALDTGLVALSRQAGSPIIGLLGLLMGLSYLIKGRRSMAGVFLALGLLGGTSFWLGLLVLGLTWLIARFLKLDLPPGLIGFSVQDVTTQNSFLTMLSAFGITLLVLGTSFSLYPAGLGALMSGLVDFTARFTQAPTLPVWQPFWMLLTNQFLPLIFAIWAGISAWVNHKRIGRLLSIWALVALGLVFAMPGRHTADLAWAIIPIWALAIPKILSCFRVDPENRNLQVIIILFALILIIFTSMNLNALADPALMQQNLLRYLLAAGAGIILLLITLILIGLGWDVGLAKYSGLMALVIWLSAITLALGFANLGPHAYRSQRIWGQGRFMPLSDMLSDTMQTLASQAGVPAEDASVLVIDSPQAGLSWVLRDFGQVRYAAMMPGDAPSDFVITKAEVYPQLAAAYRGQDFSWYETPAWQTMTIDSLLRWAVRREPLMEKTTIILWSRVELFTGSQKTN